MAIITNIKDLESLHLEPATNEDMKVILENLRTNKKLYINNKNLKVTTKYRNHKDEESIANVIEDLDFREFHSHLRKEFVYKLGHITDFKNVDNKHKIWNMKEYTDCTYKKVHSGDIVIYRYKNKCYSIAVGESASCHLYGLSCFKIINIQKAKELIHSGKIEVTTDEIIKIIKKITEKAV